MPWGSSRQDSSQPIHGPFGRGQDMSMEVDLDLQGAIEVILHKGFLFLVPEGALYEQSLLLLPSQSHPGGNAHFDLSCPLL